MKFHSQKLIHISSILIEHFRPIFYLSYCGKRSGWNFPLGLYIGLNLKGGIKYEY